MNITAGTWIRTGVLLLALVNQVLGMVGISELPISEENVAMIITTVAAVIAWWKNNSFTLIAREADKQIKRIKSM